MKQRDQLRINRGIVLLAAATLAFGPAQSGRAQATKPAIAIERVAVVDVVRGELVGPRTVLIVDGRIAAIEESGAIKIPPAAVRVDGEGRYLMPGLVDMHVHLFNNFSHRPPNDWAFPLFVANGVTGVREMAGRSADLPTVAGWRAAAAQGRLLAPDVLAVGVVLSSDSLTPGREQLRDAHAGGADFVKVFSNMCAPRWREVIEEARGLRMPVAGHIPPEVKLLDAATAGQRSNEHLTQVYEACSTLEARFLASREGLESKEIVNLRNAQEREVLESFDQAVCDRTAAALATTKQVQVPTLVLPHFESRGTRMSDRDDLRRRYLRSDEKARWDRYLGEEPVVDEKLAARRREVSRQIVGTLHKAGVRILAGTDTPMPLVYPGFSLHTELELLVEAGLSPADALRAATIWPAEFLGLSESAGSIAVGKRADLLLLDDNPLLQIGNTQHIHAVVLDGRFLQRADLDATLDALVADSALSAAAK